MPGIWETLGIEPTADLRIIRRAYAEKAKACHPEDEPEAFQQLYNAYQEALRQARSDPDGAAPAAFPSENQADLQAMESPRQEYDFDRLIARGVMEREQVLWKYRAEAVFALRDIGAHKKSSSSVPDWETFLQSSVFLRIQHDTAFMALLIDFLTLHESLPLEIWARIYESYDFPTLEHLQQKGNYTKLFSIVYPRYLQYRQKQREKRIRAMQWRQCLTWSMYLFPMVILLSSLSFAGVPSILRGCLAVLGVLAYMGCYAAVILYYPAKKKQNGKTVQARRRRSRS